MCFVFTCGEHTFRKEVEGYEGITCQCHNCGNWSGKVVKTNPWFTFCFVVRIQWPPSPPQEPPSFAPVSVEGRKGSRKGTKNTADRICFPAPLSSLSSLSPSKATRTSPATSATLPSRSRTGPTSCRCAAAAAASQESRCRIKVVRRRAGAKGRRRVSNPCAMDNPRGKSRMGRWLGCEIKVV